MQRKTPRYHLTRLKSVGMVCVLVMSGPLALTRSAKAQGFSPSVFLPNEIVSGNTYSEWAAKWNGWFISIPASINPSLDTSGKFCDESQKGIWHCETLVHGTLRKASFLSIDYR
jgi:hypothetical protein